MREAERGGEGGTPFQRDARLEQAVIGTAAVD